MIGALVRREWHLALRQPSDWLNPLLLFVMVVALFPLGVTTDPERLAEIGPGVLWVAALLAVLLSLDGLFRADYRDGVLEQVALSEWPLAGYALVKLLVHWVFTGLTLTALSPLLGLMLGLPVSVIVWNLPTLAAGTLVLSGLGVIIAALLTAVQRSGLLLSLLVLPFYIPVLILGTGAVSALGRGAGVPLALLGAYALATLAVAPWVIAGALSLSTSE